MDSKINYLFNILNDILPNQVFYAHYVTEDVKLPYIVYQELNKKSADYADDLYLYKVSTIQISLISLKKDLKLENKLEHGLDLKGITYQMISEYLGPDKTMHRIYEIKMEEFKHE